MAWQVPPLGQWNPGIPPDMNMGSYVPDQWAVMQQQNWQQWAQWQQQYAQWQNQYGEKYTEQMQAIQAMGGMPPLPPPTAPPPAPPPPEQPPPLPHENNQPLFGNSATPIQPAPVPPPTVKQPHSDNTANLDKMNTQQGNSLNWSYPKENNQQQQVTINAEALKKLAEEERLFDIQFQKWEEEIKKWKSENVNHPDKQAYQEYEQKFEACRAQLMERRQQMKLKRARLTGAPPPPMNANSSPVGNIPPAIPPPKTTSSNTFMNIQSQQYPQKSSDNGGNVQYQRQQYQSNTIGNKNSNINTESQDRYESYQNSSENKCPVVTNPNFSAPDNATFLAKSNSAKGIPGLDLVHEPEKQHGKANENNDVIDITEEKTDIQKQQQGPDYSTISKGINNILGDEKIMNILSMVREQYSKESINVPNVAAQNTQYVGNNWNNPPYSQSNRMPNYNNNNQQYDNRQNDMLCNNRQNLNYPEQKNDNKCPPQNRMYGEAQNQALQDQYGHDENQQYRGQNMPMSHNNVQARPMPPARTNMPAGRPPPQPLLEIPCPRPNQKNVNEYPHNLYERTPLSDSKINSNATQATQAARPKWIEEPMFTPALIVEYEHKPLRLKARDFIEPVHLFEYNHKSKDGVEKKVDFEKEADELFTRKPRRLEKEYDGPERFVRDYYSRDYERRIPREDLRDDNRAWVSPRDDYDDRRRLDRYDDRRKDDRGQYTRRDESHRERERDSYRDRSKDVKRDDSRDNKYHSRSRERDTRKRGHSKDSEISNTSLSKKPKDVEKTITPEQPKHVIMIDDILEPPGRDIRPSKIVIILRGPPGSGKSYLAKLIRDREAEYNGTVRIMSIDDYFMLEGEVEERDPSTGKMIKKRTLKYEYDEKSEETYFNSLKRAFKRTLTDGYFSFLILDAVNEGLKSYADIWNFARQNGFQVYICTMELDPQVCFKRNIHNRSLEDIEVLCARFSQTPAHHLQLDATTLLQNAAIPDVHMEDAEDNVVMGDAEELELGSTAPANPFDRRSSQWKTTYN